MPILDDMLNIFGIWQLTVIKNSPCDTNRLSSCHFLSQKTEIAVFL